MLAGVDDLLAVVAAVYGDKAPPRTFRLLQGVRDVQRGEDKKAVAKSLKTASGHLTKIAASPDPVAAIFKTTLDVAAAEELLAKRRQGLGQLLLAGLAERVFERLYKTALGAEELHLKDERPGYTDTDYLVQNGAGRNVFYLNIKFHGTLFTNAEAMVGLKPDDCFALATYKVWQGIEKQRVKELPYVFAIVSVPGLTGEAVGAAVPSPLIHLASLAYAAKGAGKRDVEDSIVRHLIEHPQPDEITRAIAGFTARIEEARWRVISARRGYDLLRDKLFERVYAVRVRAFAQNYRRAEVDMHFSINADLTPLSELLRLWKERGPQGVALMLERGTI